MAQHYVYRFYAALKEYKPTIWRRFEINGEKTMAELAYAVMLMFEMQASHLFCFKENTKEVFLADAGLRNLYSEDEIEAVLEKHSDSEFFKNIRYELPSEGMYLADDERLINADEIKLNRIAGKPGWKITLNYDYGDGWEVDLKLEHCGKREVSLASLPCVLEGEGYGIVEDVGGVGGLKDLAKALKKGKGKEYNDFCAWLGSTTLDLAAFDIDDMNFRLKKLLRVYKEIYEYYYEPTEKSLALLQREYMGKGSRGY